MTRSVHEPALDLTANLHVHYSCIPHPAVTPSIAIHPATHPARLLRVLRRQHLVARKPAGAQGQRMKGWQENDVMGRRGGTRPPHTWPAAHLCAWGGGSLQSASGWPCCAARSKRSSAGSSTSHPSPCEASRAECGATCGTAGLSACGLRGLPGRCTSAGGGRCMCSSRGAVAAAAPPAVVLPGWLAAAVSAGPGAALRACSWWGPCRRVSKRCAAPGLG